MSDRTTIIVIVITGAVVITAVALLIYYRNPTDSTTPTIIINSGTVKEAAPPAPSATTPTTTGPVTPGIRDRKVIAPYCDVSLSTLPNFVNLAESNGPKYFVLSFVNAKSATDKAPSWGGGKALDTLLSPVRALRAVGGDVAVSFGGALAEGSELAVINTTVDDVVSAYASVIDAFSLERIDLDIEGAILSHAESIDRRNRALKVLNQRYPNLFITYCLPLGGSGLSPDGVKLVKNAVSHNVRIGAFCGMAMNFGDWIANKPMSEVSITAMGSMRSQLLAEGISNDNVRLGIIPMIGQNDVPSNVFHLTDAVSVRDFFNTTTWMSYLGWWSVSRDQGGTVGQASPIHSGLAQNTGQFASTFLGRA